MAVEETFTTHTRILTVSFECFASAYTKVCYETDSRSTRVDVLVIRLKGGREKCTGRDNKVNYFMTGRVDYLCEGCAGSPEVLPAEGGG